MRAGLGTGSTGGVVGVGTVLVVTGPPGVVAEGSAASPVQAAAMRIRNTAIARGPVCVNRMRKLVSIDGTAWCSWPPPVVLTGVRTYTAFASLATKSDGPAVRWRWPLITDH
jgi:hypothetical protein